jgi:hypothetical protein
MRRFRKTTGIARGLPRAARAGGWGPKPDPGPRAPGSEAGPQPRGKQRNTPRATLRSIDWRAWLTLAWVAWFGLLYGKMVIEQRAQRFRELLPTAGHIPEVTPSAPAAVRR